MRDTLAARIERVEQATGPADDDAEITRSRYTTWGQPFYAALARGHDHGSAAYIADQWEAAQKRRKRALEIMQEMGL